MSAIALGHGPAGGFAEERVPATDFADDNSTALVRDECLDLGQERVGELLHGG
jgi:hypothetical protein